MLVSWVPRGWRRGFFLPFSVWELTISRADLQHQFLACCVPEGGRSQVSVE